MRVGMEIWARIAEFFTLFAVFRSSLDVAIERRLKRSRSRASSIATGGMMISIARSVGARLCNKWALAVIAVFGLASTGVHAGNLWLTGHDAELHCDGTGPQCSYFGIAVNFVRQGAPTKTLPILVLDSGTQVSDSLNGAVAKSHNTVEGAGNPFPFTVVDPSSPAFATTPISTANWSAIVIASDSSCGGCDNDSADITAINARTAAIQAFFSAGGGLLYFAGAGNRATYYSSVPIPAAAVAVAGPFTVTSVGTALGLTGTDVNCCATHNSFSLPAAGSALQVAETDGAGNAETLVAAGAVICPGGICGGGGIGAGPFVPIPTLSEWAMIVMAGMLAGVGLIQLRRRRAR
jgi:exosortase sorting signal-containing protein